MSDYEVGSLSFLGPNLPHFYRKDDSVTLGGSLVIHFKEEFLGNEFKSIPEMQKIRLLFSKSRMGLEVYGKTRDRISALMNEIADQQGMERLIVLLKLLTILADSDEYETLSSFEVTGQNNRDSDRLDKVFNYVMTHFKEDLEMSKVASLANMSYSGFCRYFKNRTKKNFTHFVNEIRIGYACKRLMESDISIRDICFECGFNNTTNFMEQFKKIIKCTPYQFKRNMTAPSPTIVLADATSG